VKATIQDASDRLRKSPLSALVVVDPETGKIPALITDNAEVAAFGKKKKPDWLAENFMACAQRCYDECARKGGCAGYAIVVTSDSLFITCRHWCMDDEGGVSIPVIQDLLGGLA